MTVNQISPATVWNGTRSIALHNEPNSVKVEFMAVAKDFYGIVWVPLAQIEPWLEGVEAATVSLGSAIRDSEGRIQEMQISAGTVVLAMAPDHSIMVGFKPGIVERFVTFEKSRLRMALDILREPANFAPVQQYLDYALGGDPGPGFAYPVYVGTGNAPFAMLMEEVQMSPVSLSKLLAAFDEMSRQEQRDSLKGPDSEEIMTLLTAGRFLYRILLRKDWVRLGVQMAPSGKWAFGMIGKPRTRDEYIPTVCNAVLEDVVEAARQALTKAV